MNKTQFYTLSGALLASTSLSGVANAGTIGRFDSGVFTTSPITITTSVFSTTASTANAVVIGGSTAAGRNFGMRYNNNFSGVTTRFTTEFTITGARFITAGLTTSNVVILTATATNVATVSGEASGAVACGSITALVEMLVVNDCAISTGMGQTGVAFGIGLTGVTFNSASGLATAGGTVTLTGRVYNPANTSQTFEAASSGTILTSAVPLQVNSTAGTSVTASATTTPLAFTSLSLPTNGSLSVTLATIRLSMTGAIDAGLAVASAVSTNLANTTAISVASSILSSAAVRSVSLVAGAGSVGPVTTVANFSSGTVTFTIGTTTWVNGTSAMVTVQFQGTTAIPSAVAGTATSSVQLSEQLATASSATAAVSQGGFRAEVNTFNASTNAPFSSYLRIHNNGAVAGVVTITVNNDDHTVGNATLGAAFTTASILPGTTMQLSAAEIEGTTTSTKLPAGGANVPTASRVGSYTLNITGPIVGYVQHILFDGKSVADMSGYRNSGNTGNQP